MKIMVEHQHRLAAEPVAEMAEDRAADGPRQEADRESAERGEGADPRVDGGKELLVEDQRRGGAVDQEVVPFDDGADRSPAQCDRVADALVVMVLPSPDSDRCRRRVLVRDSHHRTLRSRAELSLVAAILIAAKIVYGRSACSIGMKPRLRKRRSHAVRGFHL